MSQPLKDAAQFPHATRLLRCRKTQRYFTGTGWTDDPAQAQPFPDVELVLRTQATGTELLSTPVR